MTSPALDCCFYGNAFCAPHSISKNRKVFVAVARVNHTDKCRSLRPHVWCVARGRDLKPDRDSIAPPATGRPASVDAVRLRSRQAGRAAADRGRKTCRYHPGR
jgi:hypothetical protein